MFTIIMLVFINGAHNLNLETVIYASICVNFCHQNDHD